MMRPQRPDVARNHGEAVQRSATNHKSKRAKHLAEGSRVSASRGVLERQAEDEAPQERALNVSLLRAREAIMLHMRPILRAHGFTEQQWRVLRSLDATKPIDKTTLASRATLLMPSLLRIVKDLEKMGLLRGVPSENNRRLIRIILTSKGVAALDRGGKDLARMGQIVREKIGAGKYEELLNLLSMVESRLQSR